MRGLADAERLRQFLDRIARETDAEAAIYLTGGATAVLLGWRQSTVDADILIVPEIDALGAWAIRPLLAVSLNASNDAVREELMPIGRKHSLGVLRETLLRYPLRPRERITFEYVLLRGVNDSPADARRLAAFCAGIPHQLNIIPYNSHPSADFEAPDDAAVNGFARAVLAERPTILTVRRSRGSPSNCCGSRLNPRSSRIGPNGEL